MFDFFDLILRSLRLDTSLWTELSANPQALRFRGALIIVLLAGLSDGIAQSVVLILNQVKPRRFVYSLLVSAIIFVFGYFFYILSIDFIARQLFNATTSTNIYYSLALAYVPLILSFLIMLPYFGYPLGILLNIYHFLALIVATTISYSLEPLQALVSVIVGWLLLLLIKSTVGKPVVKSAIWFKNLIAGTTLEKSITVLEQRLTGEQS